MKNIDGYLKNQVDAHLTPSIQYAFFGTETNIHEMRCGLKNVKAKEHIDSSTTYHLFSITKTVTALSVLQLHEAGRIELTMPVSFYLPEFSYSKKITVQQLLSHTSGIPNPLPLKWIHLAEEHAHFNRDKFFAEIFKAHPNLDFDPGASFKYSNLGYVILGQLIEHVSGQLFEDYVRENIVERSASDPRSLNFRIDPSTHATGYHKRLSPSNALLGFLIDKRKYMTKTEGRWQPFKHFYINGTAYGGMFGSARGLTKYAQALLRANSVLLSDKYKQLFFSEYFVQGRATGMSLAWFTGSLKGHRYLAHAGGGGGYYNELRIYPDLGAGSLIMYNRSGMTDKRILDRIDSFFVTEKYLR